MKSILFIVSNELSHTIATFKVARLLRENYQVVYAGFRKNKEQVELNGFSFNEIHNPPFGLGYERIIRAENADYGYLDELIIRVSDRLFHERHSELNAFVNKLKPIHIFVDSFIFTDFIVLFRMCKKSEWGISIIQTQPPSTYNFWNPPIFSPLIPSLSIRYIIKYCKWWTIFKISFFYIRLFEKFKYFGSDDISIIKKQLRIQLIPKIFWLNLNGSALFPSLKFVKQIILLPNEFNFRPDNNKHHQYMGLCVDEERVNSHVSRQMETEFSEIQKEYNIIYCSFGTLIQLQDMKEIHLFLNNVIRYINENERYFLYLALPKEFQFDIPFDCKRIKISEWIPQLVILKYSSLFINHSGLNSIKEGIHFCVPMLCVPLNKLSDQPGNAAKIVNRNIGLRCDLKVNFNEVSCLISQLLNDIIFKNKLHEFSKYSGDVYADDKIFKSLLEIINSPNNLT